MLVVVCVFMHAACYCCARPLAEPVGVVTLPLPAQVDEAANAAQLKAFEARLDLQVQHLQLPACTYSCLLAPTAADMGL